ncbi:hypothetical protein ACMAY5_09705 [Arenicellales bacterium nBUS_48]|nr:hypothetical protein [Pseudomonadota bacterium]
MSQDKIRDQLINELESLGRFIDEGSSATELLSEVEGPIEKCAQPNIDIHNNLTSENDGPETVDMFESKTSATESIEPLFEEAASALNPPGAEQTQDNDTSIDTTNKNQDHPKKSGIEVPNANKDDNQDYLTELVDELLVTVEKRLSSYSGESLPESLRNELSTDIRSRLAPWWSDN